MILFAQEQSLSNTNLQWKPVFIFSRRIDFSPKIFQIWTANTFFLKSCVEGKNKHVLCKNRILAILQGVRASITVAPC